MAKKSKRKPIFTTDGNCPRDGNPYRKKAGLWVCPKCGNMRSLDYEPNPYYSRLERPAPSESAGYGSRRLPTNNEE